MRERHDAFFDRVAANKAFVRPNPVCEFGADDRLEETRLAPKWR